MNPNLQDLEVDQTSIGRWTSKEHDIFIDGKPRITFRIQTVWQELESNCLNDSIMNPYLGLKPRLKVHREYKTCV